MYLKKFFTILLFLFTFSLYAQIPGYYSDVNLSLSGIPLKDELATKIISTHLNTLTYSQVAEAIKLTDINPDNTAEVLLIYGYENGTDSEPDNDRARALQATCNSGSCQGLWSREHVFSNSLGNPKLNANGTSGPYTDVHNLRSCDAPTNNSRGNKLFAVGSGNSSAVTGGWYPGDEWKGDVARIAMYMYLRYGSQCLPTYLGVGSNAATPDDMIDLFLQWNVDDPVSDFEKQRNTYHDSNATYAQGNRNPFIDNPAFATQIWGGTQAEDFFSASYDDEAPSIPSDLAVVNLTGNSFILTWSAASDNTLVTGYRLLLDDNFIGTSNTHQYHFTSLAAATSYQVKVQAFDANGNTSASSDAVIVHTGADAAIASDLLFSEYVEGSANNKALEITNYTGNAVDLSIYTLKKQTNGGGSWSNGFNLSGVLGNGAAFVIANNSAASSLTDNADVITGSGQVTFNGNDPVGLFKNDVLIDIIGVFDGGTGNFAKDITLQRKPNIKSPNITYTISEWDSFAKDTFTGIGNHLITGTNTFLGTIDTDWDNAANWSLGIVPNGTDAIIKADKVANAAGAISVDNLTLETNAALEVGLQVHAVGTVLLATEASLIAKNSTSFDFTYHRYLENENWHLMSSPVTDETFANFIANHSFATGSNGNIGIGAYDNTTPGWTYANASTTGTLSNGAGHSIKLTAPGTITLSGALPIVDRNIAITHGGASGNGFNLIGNPFPSYLAANHTSATALHNLLSINSALLAEQTLWFWNQELKSYKQINQASALIEGIRYIAPGQGFFVKANATGGSFTFPESLQSNQSEDLFGKAAQDHTHIKLNLSTANFESDTDIIYMDGATLGWDNGLDATVFGGAHQNFGIYTELVADNEGQHLGIQSVPFVGFEEVIAIGVHAAKDTSIEISATLTNLPNTYQVYLEDRFLQTFTLLDTSSKYSTTLTTGLNGVGRYYLHTSSAALNTTSYDLKTISIFTTDDNVLHIEGVANEVGKLIIYDVTGRLVLQTSFSGNGNNTMQLPHLKRGMYLVQVCVAKGIITKKLMLD